jgi:hypothetical protein
MIARAACLLLAILACIAPCFASAAAIALPVTPARVSVAGNESAVFSVRFLDAQGRPAAGEPVQFLNDACGWFPNGAAAYTTTTDANGIASARFTAFPQGITCWVVASAGAEARFDVLTYVAAYAYLDANVPARILPGQPFSVSAAAMYGAYRLYDADIAARIVPGTGTATITPSSANSGQEGAVTFGITPSGSGDFDIELQFRDHLQRFAVKMSEAPWQDLWWAGWGENGWGMSVVQHRDILFSVIYAYDDAGKPVWFVMPGGSWNAARTVFSGPLYRPHGAPFTAYDTSQFDVGAPVGQAALDFTNPSRVVLSYTIDGVSGRKSISRQPFGPVDLSGGIDVGDMWWGGMAQNGWGIAVLQQYRTLFAVWFTYDGEGKPVWYVMPSGSWSDAQTWAGRIYRPTGSAWLGRAYDPSLFRTVDVGMFRLRFSGDTGTFDYTIDGRSGSIPIQRQPF